MTHTEFPKLMWHGVTNMEITVRDRQEQEEKKAAGYELLPVGEIKIDPVENLSQMLSGLTELEQEFILDQQKKARMASIAERLANLSDGELERLLAAKTSRKKKSA